MGPTIGRAARIRARRVLLARRREVRGAVVTREVDERWAPRMAGGLRGAVLERGVKRAWVRGIFAEGAMTADGVLRTR